LFQEEEEEDMTITLEDLRGDSPAICGDFNKIKEEVIGAVGEDQNEVERLLTERILMEFVQFHMKKRELYLDKKKKRRVALKILPPKKPLESKPNNIGNINKNQEKEEEEGKSRRKVQETKEAEEEPDRDQTSDSGPTTLHANRVQEQNHGAAGFGHQSCHSKSID
jgi:hypothetical protein